MTNPGPGGQVWKAGRKEGESEKTANDVVILSALCSPPPTKIKKKKMPAGL